MEVPDSDSPDAYTVTVSVCISHGDTRSYPVRVTISNTNHDAALALADAIRNSVRDAV